MKYNTIFFAGILLVCQCSAVAQNAADAKKNEKQFVFITLPMGVSIPPIASKEDALNAAMFYLASKDQAVINCIHLETCKITKTEDLGVDVEESPTLTKNGGLNMSATVKARIKRCAVTWDAEFVVDKDIGLKHLYLNGIGGLFDWSLLSYFENNLDPTFKDWILTGIYKDKIAPMLKAGQKFKLTGIHSSMYGLASDDKWTCFILRDKKKEATVTIQLTKATTLDAKSVSVDYEIKEAPAKALHFDVYRSKTDHLDDLLSITESNDLKKLGDTTIHQEINYTNTAVADASLTVGKHTSLTFIKGTELKPDTRMPYIIVVATCNGTKTQVYFKKWMLGVISHGFDRWAIEDPTFTTINEIQGLDVLKLVYKSPIARGYMILCNDLALPSWEKNMAKSLKDNDHYDSVISFDWMATCAKPDHSYAVDASSKLFFQILKYFNYHSQYHAGDIIDVHFIGHSRGACVVTLALYILKAAISTKISSFGGSYVQLTLLDPHPANNELEPKTGSEPNITNWGSWGTALEGVDNQLKLAQNTLPVDIMVKLIRLKSILSTQSIAATLESAVSSGSDLKELMDYVYNHGVLKSIWKTTNSGCSNVLGGLSFLFDDFFSLKANAATTDFQDKVSDNALDIPAGVKKIDIYYQHTPARFLYEQPDQEYIQNLWGMVSPATISCEDGTIDLEKFKMDLTNVTIDGIGAIGHNEVPIVYLQLWVDAGDLNRSSDNPPAKSTNNRP